MSKKNPIVKSIHFDAKVDGKQFRELSFPVYEGEFTKEDIMVEEGNMQSIFLNKDIYDLDMCLHGTRLAIVLYKVINDETDYTNEIRATNVKVTYDE